jgi:hypothetical protein
MATNLTSKGQLTVPKAVRAARKRAGARAGAWARLRGRATVRLSTEEIMVLARGDCASDPG